MQFMKYHMYDSSALRASTKFDHKGKLILIPLLWELTAQKIHDNLIHLNCKN